MHVVVALAIGLLGTAYAIRYVISVHRSPAGGQLMSAAQAIRAPEGSLVEVEGTIDGPPLVAPISGTPCAWWRVLVVDAVNNTTRTLGVHLDRAARTQLEVRDATGAVRVDATNSTGAGAVTWQVDERADIGRRLVIEGEVHQLPGRDAWRSHREQVLTSGSRCWIAGRLVGGCLTGSPEAPVTLTTTPPEVRHRQRSRNLVLGAAAVVACPLLGLLAYVVGR